MAGLILLPVIGGVGYFGYSYFLTSRKLRWAAAAFLGGCVVNGVEFMFMGHNQEDWPGLKQLPADPLRYAVYNRGFVGGIVAAGAIWYFMK